MTADIEVPPEILDTDTLDPVPPPNQDIHNAPSIILKNITTIQIDIVIPAVLVMIIITNPLQIIITNLPLLITTDILPTITLPIVITLVTDLETIPLTAPAQISKTTIDRIALLQNLDTLIEIAPTQTQVITTYPLLTLLIQILHQIKNLPLILKSTCII